MHNESEKKDKYIRKEYNIFKQVFLIHGHIEKKKHIGDQGKKVVLKVISVGTAVIDMEKQNLEHRNICLPNTLVILAFLALGDIIDIKTVKETLM